MTTKRHHLIGMLVTIGGAIAYGAYPPAIRAIYADGANTSYIVLVVALLRCFTLWLFCFLTKKPLFLQQDNKNVVIGGFLQAVSTLAIYSALAYLPGPIVILIIFLHTLILLFVMAWRGEMAVDMATILTTFIAILGLTFVLDVWHRNQNFQYMGLGIALIATLATAGRVYLYGKQTKIKHPAVVGAESFFVTALVVVVYCLFRQPQFPHSPQGYVWTGLTCLSQTLGTFGMLYGIALLGSFQYALLAKLEPVFTALFSVLLIGEVLKLGQYIGIVIVILSLGQYQYMNHRKSKRTENPITVIK